jgi:serine/threonine protein kinase
VAKGLDPALIGRTIAGKYTIESYIGAGAMGAVYKARQAALDKVLAIKVLHRELTNDESFTARFKREAKAASRLDHPNSMRVVDFGSEPDGLLYIAMEHLDGRDLLQVIVEDWPLSGQRIATILAQALAALAVAHDMGVVHRDLKPENIMILRGVNDEGLPADVVKVCDFGIAKITQHRMAGNTDAGGPLTAQGLVVGTPEYMSPEQGRGESLDLRSDLYSMGVILYQLLTGRVPFEAESALGIVFKHVTEEPVPPSSINPTIDRRLEAICLKAMRKRREDRQQSAREMRAELKTMSDGSMSILVPTSSPSAVDDTLPLPAMTDARTSPGVGVLRSSRGTPYLHGAVPDPLPKTTSSATFLDGQRHSRVPPSPVLLGVASLAIGAVVAIALFARERGPAEDARAPASSAYPSSTVVELPSASVKDEATALPEPPPTGSSAASVPSRSAGPARSGAAAHEREARASEASPQAIASPAHGASSPSSPTSSKGSTSFDLTVASANPTVLRATGA